MNFLARGSYLYVLWIWTAIDGYVKWCEGHASTEAQLRWLAIAPIAVFGFVLFSLPETVARIVAGTILVPPIYLGLAAIVASIRSR